VSLCLYSLNQEECGQDEVDEMKEEAGEISHCSIVSMSQKHISRLCCK